MIKRSVIIANRHQTSISLEDEFYTELQEICKKKNKSINEMITEIDSTRTNPNLSSAIRIYILNELKSQISKNIS